MRARSLHRFAWLCTVCVCVCARSCQCVIRVIFCLFIFRRYFYDSRNYCSILHSAPTQTQMFIRLLCQLYSFFFGNRSVDVVCACARCASCSAMLHVVGKNDSKLNSKVYPNRDERTSNGSSSSDSKNKRSEDDDDDVDVFLVVIERVGSMGERYFIIV